MLERVKYFVRIARAAIEYARGVFELIEYVSDRWPKWDFGDKDANSLEEK